MLTDIETAVDSSGLTRVVWQDSRLPYPDNPRIFAQFFSASGEAIGSNFSVNSDLGGSGYLNPDVAALGNSRFICTWQISIYDICGQIYAADAGVEGTGVYFSSGVYPLSLKANNNLKTLKLNLIR